MTTRSLPEGMKVDPSDPAYCAWRDQRETFTTTIPGAETLSGVELFSLLQTRAELVQPLLACGVSQLGKSKNGEFIVGMMRFIPRESIQKALHELATGIGKNIQTVLVDVTL
ncbi:MAG: hypothetical protein WCV62_00115 [Candidatus Peribacteraceae bacterium]|jgi:hypothetical protein